MNIEALRAATSPWPHYGARLNHLRVAAFGDKFIIEDIGGHYLTCASAEDLIELLRIEAAGPHGGYVEELIYGTNPHEEFLKEAPPPLPVPSLSLEDLGIEL